MLPDIWSNASAREPEFSNCVLGKSVVSCVDSLISWASLLPNPLGCCLWSSVSTKRSGCPAQSQTCPGLYSDSESEWSILLFSQQKIYGYPSWCWFQSAKSEAGFSSMSGRSNIIPDIVISHLQVLYPLLDTAPGTNWHTDGQGALILGYQSPTDTNTTSMSWIFTHAQCYLLEASLQVWSFLLRNVPRTSW